MQITLDQYLRDWAESDALLGDIAATIVAIASACLGISELLSAGALAGDLAAHIGDGGGGDAQTRLDAWANDLLVAALRRAPVAAVASEEMEVPLRLDAQAPLLVVLDPLDGSSNIATNVSVGTIFSLLQNPSPASGEPAAFLRKGRAQVAAGYVIYGSHTALVLTLGAGTDVFTLDAARGAFVRTAARVRIPPRAQEFAINASNYRHWDEAVRLWFDDCLAGTGGIRGYDFNMRWIASMVAEAHRILTRGGVYLYPGDARPGYRSGRLRLLYEAHPIAFLIEQAGGAASTGFEPILDRVPRLLHERVPLVFGAREEVERIERYHATLFPRREGSPLFGQRGLFVS